MDPKPAEWGVGVPGKVRARDLNPAHHLIRDTQPGTAKFPAVVISLDHGEGKKVSQEE